ncbi:MAG: leucine-rich repeat domain-containing protein [Bacteroidales bacterium]|nr:leucine-rich repeat domain-containing protein [Bacteroidales bacterium]
MNKLKRKTSLLQRITAMIAALLFVSSTTMAADDKPQVTIQGIVYTIDVSTNTASATGHTSDLTTSVIIKDAVDYENKTYPVTSIGNGAFVWCTSISTLIIPEGVKTIGSAAFSLCQGLKDVTIPESVESIGDQAFFLCCYIESLTVPKNVKSIGETAFYSVLNVDNSTSYTEGQPWGAYSLNGEFDIEINAETEEVILKKYNGKGGDVFIYPGITTISDYSFIGRTNITSVTFSDGVKKVGHFAFAFCDNLNSVTIPSSVEYIGDWAFGYVKNLINNSSCTDGVPWGALTLNGEVDGDFVFEPNTNKTVLSAYIGKGGSVKIPKSVTTIDEYAFYNCSKLSPIDIPEGVETIVNYAFQNCKMVTIPKSVTAIQANAFLNVKNIINKTDLTNDDLWGALTLNGDIDGDFVYKANTDKKILTGYIGNGGDVVIPDGVTSIGTYAFSYSDVTSLTIPESVATIGEFAFFACGKITEVFCSANPAELNNIVTDEYMLPGFDDELVMTYHVLNEYLEAWKAKFTGKTNVTFVGDMKSIADVTIPSQKYTGKALTPVVKDGDKTLTLGTDYTISPAYGEYINAGDYKITITGIHSYYKSAEKTFTITAQPQPTPVANIADSPRVKVWSFKSTIFIESAPDAKYSIYDLNGRVITTSTTKSTKEEIKINKPGIVVVIVDGYSYKVAVD